MGIVIKIVWWAVHLFALTSTIVVQRTYTQRQFAIFFCFHSLLSSSEMLFQFSHYCCCLARIRLIERAHLFNIEWFGRFGFSFDFCYELILECFVCFVCDWKFSITRKGVDVINVIVTARTPSPHQKLQYLTLLNFC